MLRIVRVLIWYGGIPRVSLPSTAETSMVVHAYDLRVFA